MHRLNVTMPPGAVRSRTISVVLLNDAGPARARAGISARCNYLMPPVRILGRQSPAGCTDGSTERHSGAISAADTQEIGLTQEEQQACFVSVGIKQRFILQHICDSVIQSTRCLSGGTGFPPPSVLVQASRYCCYSKEEKTERCDTKLGIW